MLGGYFGSCSSYKSSCCAGSCAGSCAFKKQQNTLFLRCLCC
jgi:hypothetical protein